MAGKETTGKKENMVKKEKSEKKTAAGKTKRGGGKQKNASGSNKKILGTAYVIAGLFLALMVYFGYFVQIQSEEVINNPYNKRTDLFAEKIIRGDILAADGSVLATTQVDENGGETRVYPYGSVFDHIVGYSSMGKTGVESLANFYLLTSHVNLLEQAANELAGQKNLGDDVYTTLDTELQQVAYEALGNKKGAVIAMEPDTGKVLAMVSKPGYDPNTLLQDWEALNAQDNADSPLLNRATQGLYPPGSTFKIVTALEAVRERPKDYNAYTFDCDGVYENGEYSIRCFHGNAHGHQDFETAFANSCNGAFSNLGLELNLAGFYQTAEDLLFNQEIPSGGLPYKESSFEMKEGADTWEILQTSIGQGKTLITPIHNALITSAIANGGTLMKPYLLDRVVSAGEEEVKKFLPSFYGTLMSADEAQTLTGLMTKVVAEGTASALRTDAYTVAAKTGTAEYETGKETHAWCTAFAPAQSPKLVVTVLVEEGGSGGKAAAPIARKLFDVYFSR